MSTHDDATKHDAVGTAPAAAAAAAGATRFENIVVAVHGIGEQIRYSTVRCVATRLVTSLTLRGKSP